MPTLVVRSFSSSLLARIYLTFTALLIFIAYFEFVQPAQGTEWQNGKANPIIWKKGLLDGVLMFDLEIARLSQDGLIKVALNGVILVSFESSLC